MNKLEDLSLDYNLVSDITPLKNHKSLMSVSFHENQVSDISALASCSSLETINISYNNVDNIESLYGLENLYLLTAYENLDQKIIPRSQIEQLINSNVSVLYHE